MNTKHKQVTAEQQEQSFNKAVSNQSFSNYAPIFEGFIAKGIDINDIKPRENIFTFNAWLYVGRIVKKGEHGVKIVTVVKTEPTETKKASSFIRSVTVFHISQTESKIDKQ